MTNYEILKKRDMLAEMEERLHKDCCWCVNREMCGYPASKPSEEACKEMWRSFFKGADTPEKLANRMYRAADCDICPVAGMCGNIKCGCETAIVAWLRSENLLYDMAMERSKHGRDRIRRREAIEVIDNTDWYHQNANKDMVSGANPDRHQAWYKAEDVYNALESVPSAQPEQLTDKEQRIFLAAMGREEKVCKEVDEECSREPYEDSLVRICHEITRKVKGALWNGGCSKERERFIRYALEELPSAQPEQRWIPCDKGEPEEDMECWVTVKTTDVLYRGNFTKRYGERRDKGFITSGGFMWWNAALAWMPIYEPEPYRTEVDEF